MATKLATTARHLNACRGPVRHRDRLPPLVLLTDRARLPDPCAAARRLPAGSLVILRDGDLGAGARLHLGRALAAVCRRRRLRLLVAGDPALARRLGAAGVHWPERQLPLKVRGFATAAAHGARALVRARRAGVAAALLSPVLPTASHPGAPALGVVRFAGLARRAGLPVYALGGIDEGTAPRLRGSGAAGIAAIGAFRP
ncbi:thiamine-phosphate pyrophosphorylase [Zavarzinia compransoris]|uniref:Thiamine phosphate synthase n=2 Tax=Zavarzinia compransoris TaxID=1264899 RepID=A0A317E542_9PROT|nr:thiamine phosphate synthase [Zavarzinia compransoris]TDP43840.1 thiamine-phosphate pyrophosphorylase [Zavarzinia compransoris]